MKYPKSQSKSKDSKKVVPKSVKNYVKKTLAATIEDKYTDTVYASYQPNYSYGFHTQLTPPVQGIGSSQRIGDKIRPTKIQVYGQYYGANTHLLRIIVYRWHPVSIPAGSDILDNVYVNTFRAPFAPYNNDKISQYTILKDKMYNLSAYGSNNIPFKFNISRKKLAAQEFNAGAVTGSNLIYVLMIQDGIATLNTVDAVFRLWYEDA